jgi:hypothetical protein
MESDVKENLKKPFFQGLLNEWALHIESGTDAIVFVNIFLNEMRYMDSENGKACALFARYMESHDWAEILFVLKPNLNSEISEIFESPKAKDFYEAFQATVSSQIREHKEKFVARPDPWMN